MDTHTTTEAYRPNYVKKRWYQQLYFWVLIAIVIGVLLGWLSPNPRGSRWSRSAPPSSPR